MDSDDIILEYFSQHFEDVLLARCFNQLASGFYIDVGAQDEEGDSVTKFFYNRGWNGINIEPVKKYAESFRVRDRDITVCCAAGAQAGTAILASCQNSGLSTLKSENIKIIEEQGITFSHVEVPVKTLDQILGELGHSNLAFQFLKIDAEGFELDVLNGISLQRYRPEIILYESTIPCSPVKAGYTIQLEQLLSSNGFSHLYFDGLNDWWASNESYERHRQHFIYPVGIFDGFGPSRIRRLIQNSTQVSTIPTEREKNNSKSFKNRARQIFARLLFRDS